MNTVLGAKVSDCSEFTYDPFTNKDKIVYEENHCKVTRKSTVSHCKVTATHFLVTYSYKL